MSWNQTISNPNFTSHKLIRLKLVWNDPIVVKYLNAAIKKRLEAANTIQTRRFSCRQKQQAWWGLNVQEPRWAVRWIIYAMHDQFVVFFNPTIHVPLSSHPSTYHLISRFLICMFSQLMWFSTTHTHTHIHIHANSTSIRTYNIIYNTMWYDMIWSIMADAVQLPAKNLNRIRTTACYHEFTNLMRCRALGVFPNVIIPMLKSVEVYTFLKNIFLAPSLIKQVSFTSR